MIRLVAIVCVLFLVCVSCDQGASPYQDLSETVAEVNSRCPAMLDSETRIDGVQMMAENTLRYNYTLVNLLSQNVDTAQFRRALWPGILGMIRVSSDMQKLRDQNATIEYHYKDKQGAPIYTFVIRPEHYNGK